MGVPGAALNCTLGIAPQYDENAGRIRGKVTTFLNAKLCPNKLDDPRVDVRFPHRLSTRDEHAGNVPRPAIGRSFFWTTSRAVRPPGSARHRAGEVGHENALRLSQYASFASPSVVSRQAPVSRSALQGDFIFSDH